MYNPYSFIDDSTFPVKIAFRIIGNPGSPNYVINVCKYQKSYTRGNYLYIISNNFINPIVLDFKSESEAILAFDIFIKKINLYRVNCKENSGGGGGDEYEGPHHISFNSTNCLPPAECRTWIVPSLPTIPTLLDYSQVLGLGDYEGKKVELYFNGQKLIRNQEFELVGNELRIKTNPNYNSGITISEDNYPFMIYINNTEKDILEAIIY